MNIFNQPRVATIQFNDVFGHILQSNGNELIDFDAELTAQVRNTHQWHDVHYPIGQWPELGDYGLVLIEQLRQEQQLAKIDASHPDGLALKSSLDGTVVCIVNSAPRRSNHSEEHSNGDEFYFAQTKAGNSVLAQIEYLRGLHARGYIERLWRIPNEAGIWQKGEQFRSSIVSNARQFSDALVPVTLDLIPKIDKNARIAFVDTFGNIRIEVKHFDRIAYLIDTHQKVDIQLLDQVLSAHCVKRLIDIPIDEFGVYYNPTELHHGDVGYIELIRRVETPNQIDISALHKIAELTGVATADLWWQKCEVRLSA